MFRENRYKVFKISDVLEALSEDERKLLLSLGEKVAAYRESAGKAPIECVVVESDWPEYEETWVAIASRVDGVPPYRARIQQLEDYPE